MTKALHSSRAFFALPEAGASEDGITPLESKEQPTGFSDGLGFWWVAIMTEAGLKRKMV